MNVVEIKNIVGSNFPNNPLWQCQGDADGHASLFA